MNISLTTSDWALYLLNRWVSSGVLLHIADSLNGFCWFWCKRVELRPVLTATFTTNLKHYCWCSKLYPKLKTMAGIALIKNALVCYRDCGPVTLQTNIFTALSGRGRRKKKAFNKDNKIIMSSSFCSAQLNSDRSRSCPYLRVSAWFHALKCKSTIKSGPYNPNNDAIFTERRKRAKPSA